VPVNIYLFIRFFETSAVAILILLISKFKISIKDEPQFASETFQEKKERLSKSKVQLTLTYVCFAFQYVSMTKDCLSQS
jgi:hypothetical protein